MGAKVPIGREMDPVTKAGAEEGRSCGDHGDQAYYTSIMIVFVH